MPKLLLDPDLLEELKQFCSDEYNGIPELDRQWKLVSHCCDNFQHIVEKWGVPLTTENQEIYDQYSKFVAKYCRKIF